ncbi:MAG: hypothetical protein HY876_08970 [Coriobacteriales bacterium]|nr:hypothetical protein [Coriobacteriales bacterium]
MPLLSAHGLEGVDVFNDRDKFVGTVGRVLFHPSEPRAVGYEIERPRLWLVIKRGPAYLALDSAVPRNEKVTIETPGRDAWGKRAAKRLGFSWDDTVVWRHMPVHTRSDKPFGNVSDVIFEPDGPIRRVELSEGVAADVALGCREVDGPLVIGFDGQVVRVEDAAAEVDFTGGAAAMAGKGTALAADAATKAGAAAGRAAGKAVAYGKSAAKVAAQSETGKKAMDWLKRAKDATLDAMSAPEDED